MQMCETKLYTCFQLWSACFVLGCDESLWWCSSLFPKRILCLFITLPLSLVCRKQCVCSDHEMCWQRVLHVHVFRGGVTWWVSGCCAPLTVPLNQRLFITEHWDSVWRGVWASLANPGSWTWVKLFCFMAEFCFLKCLHLMAEFCFLKCLRLMVEFCFLKCFRLMVEVCFLKCFCLIAEFCFLKCLHLMAEFCFLKCLCLMSEFRCLKMPNKEILILKIPPPPLFPKKALFLFPNNFC